MPLDDWQFWAVSAAALAAATWLLRGLLPFKRWRNAKGRKATLTISAPRAHKQ